MNGAMLKTLFYLLTYAFSTVFTVYLAMLSEQNWRPLPFSEFYLSTAEVMNIALVLGGTTFFTISLGRLVAKPLKNKQKFSLDYLNFLLAYTLSILYFLLASSITFSPNLFVYIGIYASTFALALHLVFIYPSQAFLSEVINAITDVFKRFTTLYGVIVLLLFMTPMALAIGFIFSREVADVITEIRLQFNNTEDAQWTLVPALNHTVFSRPMIVRFSKQTPQYLYVLERSGDLYQVDYPSGNNKNLILDIKDKVGLVDVENGALGLVLHPQFSDQSSENFKHIFIYYTSVHQGIQKNIISRFDLASTSNSKDIKETPLMVLQRTNDAYHNGGSVEFGHDGFLYISLGEGVYLDKKKHTSQALRAAILRVDVDQRGGNISQPILTQPTHGETSNYYIPNDNPFIGNDKVLDEYWAMGLRNPFRISFDSKDGSLWAGDVGSTVWEEVNKVIKGGNYLYPYIEGPPTDDFIVPKALVGQPKHPTYTYKHSAFDRAVIGGVVYRGKALTQLQGLYLFGDNFSGKLFGIKTDQIPVGQAQLVAQAQQYAQRGISSITYSPEGEVFVTLLGAKGDDTGQVMRLAQADTAKKHSLPSPQITTKHVYSYQETKSLYLEMCARCHGNEGTGQGPDAKSFDVDIADFTSDTFQQGKTDKKLHNIIKRGGAANNLSPYMPPWQWVLSDHEIDDLINYIKSLQ